MAFDQSGPRWLGISDLIAEPEGPTFISYKVARSRLDRLRFVTQDPDRSSKRRTADRLSGLGISSLRTLGRRPALGDLAAEAWSRTRQRDNEIDEVVLPS